MEQTDFMCGYQQHTKAPVIQRRNMVDTFPQIPVFQGLGGPLVGATELPKDHFGSDGLGDILVDRDPDWRQKIQKEHAVNAMIRLVSENPNQVGETTPVVPLNLCSVAVLSWNRDPIPGFSFCAAGVPSGPRPSHKPGHGGEA